ncbi:FUSC family protein [Rhodococcus sp. NPDC003322]
MAGTVDGPLRRALRYLSITDPGHQRLRSGLITVTALGLAVAALALFGRVGHTTPAVLLGSYVAIQASTAVKDSTQRERVITTAFLVVPALVSVTVATLLARFDRIADLGFVVALFIAVWIRRWGPRGLASGMVVYISYFYALVLHATVAELPLLCLGICTGVAVTVFVRTVVFPETPLREINSLLEALRAESRSGLDVIRRSAGSDGSAPSRTLDRMETTAMMIEDWIDRNDTRSCLGVESAELSRAVFDAQVTTEEAFAFMASLWPRRGACVSRAADELADVLRPNPTAEHASDSLVRARAAAESVDADTEEGFAAQLAYRAVEAHATLGQLGRRTPVAPDTAREHRASRTEGGDSSVRSASDRAAVQVAVAATAAMVAGSLVNPGHWYWAVVTAFLVYTGTSTRGEVLARAGERVAGTIGGVTAGVVLAALVGHHAGLQIVLVMTSVFFAFYLKAVNYVLQTFFMTVMLAGLYGLLGEFSVDLLLVRIEETAVGAAVGVATAFLVLATSSRAVFVDAVDTYLARLSDLLDRCSGTAKGVGTAAEVVATTRALDARLAAVRAAAVPLIEDPMTRGRRSVAWFERRLRETNRGAHALARAGAVTVPQQEPACGAGRALESVIRDVQGNIELVRRRNAGHRGGAPVRLDDTAVTGHVGRSGSADPDQCVATLFPPLIRINRSLVALVE